ncbi:MAG: TAXI family TRAP transporter solute-binding subunit [Geminicoccaceae bacterium]
MTHNRDLWKIVTPSAVLVVVAFLIAAQFVRPGPPPALTMATGPDGGGFAAFGDAYSAAFAEHHVTLHLRPTGGSIENLALLADPQSGVDAALVQGGVLDSYKAANLVALAGVVVEPLWLFVRPGLDIDDERALQGLRIALGPDGSGTQPAVRKLFALNGIDDANTTLIPLEPKTAVAALRKGEVDAFAYVTAMSADLLDDLLADPDLSLISFTRAEGYAQGNGYLSHVTLHRGVLDLAQDRPRSDVELVAYHSMLVARPDLHADTVQLYLQVLEEVHGGGDIFSPPETFPSEHHVELPLHPVAERWFERGPSALQHYLPFWWASWVERWAIMLIPLLLLALPLLRFLPPYLNWRARMRVYRWYGRIGAVEAQAREGALTSATRRQLIGELNDIEDEVTQIELPLAHTNLLYSLRAHIDLVRERLWNEDRAPLQRGAIDRAASDDV